MELILAMDLMGGRVVCGSGGMRSSYTPLDWGISPSAEPVAFVEAVAPRSLYIADLDRIERRGAHDEITIRLAAMTDRCYVDRGIRSPGEYLDAPHLINVVGTETGGAGVEDLARYTGGYLSIDVKEGRVIPWGIDPLEMLRRAGEMAFEGCILLHLGGVGTASGLDQAFLEEVRAAYEGRLFWGGGVAGCGDLEMLAGTGFDGAIIATALHRGAIPLGWIRRGSVC